VITIDANVYISAIAIGGKPATLLLQAAEGEIDVAISQPILDEVLRILRQKFKRSEADLAEAEERIRSFTQMVTPTDSLNVVVEDPDDNRILECAVASGSDVIVTGDNDLLRLGAYQGIRIVKTAEFLQRR
jgi:putative PIN family toxin of toxin-antitoxin system